MNTGFVIPWVDGPEFLVELASALTDMVVNEGRKITVPIEAAAYARAHRSALCALLGWSCGESTDEVIEVKTEMHENASCKIVSVRRLA